MSEVRTDPIFTIFIFPHISIFHIKPAELIKYFDDNLPIMKNQIGDGDKHQRRDVIFGLTAAVMSLVLLVFVERSLLSLDTPMACRS